MEETPKNHGESAGGNGAEALSKMPSFEEHMDKIQEKEFIKKEQNVKEFVIGSATGLIMQAIDDDRSNGDTGVFYGCYCPPDLKKQFETV